MLTKQKATPKIGATLSYIVKSDFSFRRCFIVVQINQKLASSLLNRIELVLLRFLVLLRLFRYRSSRFIPLNESENRFANGWTLS